MPDNLTPQDRKKTMRAVKGKRTGLEKKLFSMLAGMRLRGWKKNDGSVLGKPDVVFWDRKVVIFVDGCFWHGCPVCRRPLPETNVEYWRRKIVRNVERGRNHDEKLVAEGWAVIHVWEHEIVNVGRRAEIRACIRKGLAREGSDGHRRADSAAEPANPQ